MKRDYLGLKELMQEIKAIETKQECCGDTRIMIGMVFLCDRLQDSNMEVTKNNIRRLFFKSLSKRNMPDREAKR